MSLDRPAKQRKRRKTERGNPSQYYLIVTCFLLGVVAVLILPLEKVRFDVAWVADPAEQSVPAASEAYTESFWDDLYPSRDSVGGVRRPDRKSAASESQADFDPVQDPSRKKTSRDSRRGVTRMVGPSVRNLCLLNGD